MNASPTSLMAHTLPEIDTCASAGGAERVLHLVDVENLLGGPNFTPERAAWVHRAYAATAPNGRVNQVIVATSHRAAPSTWFAWPESARRLVRSGPDGADDALLHVLAAESVERRFDHVVIGSGDHIFAFRARRLQNDGRQVSVVAVRGSLSNQLRLAVADIRFLDAPPAAVGGRPSAGANHV